jgi:hypothetical protein
VERIQLATPEGPVDAVVASPRAPSFRPSGGTRSTPTTERINGSENCCVPPLCTSPPRSPGLRQ